MSQKIRRKKEVSDTQNFHINVNHRRIASAVAAALGWLVCWRLALVCIVVVIVVVGTKLEMFSRIKLALFYLPLLVPFLFKSCATINNNF